MNDEELVKAWKEAEGNAEQRAELAKSAPSGSVAKMEFNIVTEGSVGSVFKADDDFVIWGPASVEVVDKENDRIKAEALQDALPQLLKRQRLSYEHSDQIVGDILERFETDEPVEVTINGKSYQRTEFPTDVLKLEGQKPALYVTGNIYNDTQKSQEVRKQIENGEIDSYSISGEAVVTEMAVKDGRTFTDILKLDLSAVTVCSEGMNQYAKFDTVSKRGERLTPLRAATLAKSKIKDKTMDQDDDVKKFVDALDKTLDERLPDGELATKEDVEEIVDERMKAQEDSPTQGTPDRPDGRSDRATETDAEYDGDVDEWGEPPTNDSDKVETTQVEDDKTASASSYTMEELKSVLPDDQFKAIEPLLERAGGEEHDPFVDHDEEAPPEEVEPDADPLTEEAMDEEQEVMAAEKSASDLDWNRLTDDQKVALVKSGALEKAESGVRSPQGVGADVEPAHAGDSDIVKAGDLMLKADNDSVSRDPSMRKIYDEEGNPQL